MIPHTPTLFGSVALVAILMGGCLLLAGQFNRRDGLITCGGGLLAHALAYVCFTVYGHAELWLTYVVGNSLLSTALALYAASIYRVGGLPVPWLLLLSLPTTMLVGLGTLIGTQEPRMLLACLVLILQCLLIMHLAYRYGRVGGRAHILLLIGTSISLIGLGLRIVAIVSGDAASMRYDNSGLRQAISVSIGTVTVMMLSLGVVLLSKEKIEASLQTMALHDPLTGILNRGAIMAELKREIERARRTGNPMAIVMIDIDHFKRVNDRFGHLAGDEVLRHCVDLLRARLRQTDRIGRYGGEEFLVLLPDTLAQGAYTTIEALRTAISAMPVSYAGRNISVSFSAGIWCGIPEAQHSADQLIARADKALYASKAAGRNTLRLSPLEDFSQLSRNLPDC